MLHACDLSLSKIRSVLFSKMDQDESFLTKKDNWILESCVTIVCVLFTWQLSK